MEHSLHLAAGHVLSSITLMHTETLRKARNESNDDKNDDMSDDAASSDECSAIITNGLRKLLGLIKQVRLILCLCSIH
jgi:hypothetical protein